MQVPSSRSQLKELTEDTTVVRSSQHNQLLSLPFLTQCLSSHSNSAVTSLWLPALQILQPAFPQQMVKDRHTFAYRVQETNQETKPCRPLSPYFKVPVTFPVLHIMGLVVRWREREREGLTWLFRLQILDQAFL